MTIIWYTCFCDFYDGCTTVFDILQIIKKQVLKNI